MIYAIVAAETTSPASVLYGTPEFTAPKNYTDPIKIKDYVEKKKEAWLDELSSNPVLAEVLKFSFKFDESKPETKPITLAGDSDDSGFISTLKTIEDYIIGQDIKAEDFTWFGFDVDFTVRLIRHKAAAHNMPTLAALTRASRVDLWSVLGVKSSYITKEAAISIWAKSVDNYIDMAKASQIRASVALAEQVVQAYGY
jgi:hypothetical protein